MNQEKKLSIIIPHYNDSEKIIRLLNSIPTSEFLEVIVIDDHSTSEHMEWCSSINSEFITVTSLISKANAGVARNVGLEIASGKYVIFADADDCFTDDAFDIIFKYIDESNSDLVILGTKSFIEGSNLPSERDQYRSRIWTMSPSKAALNAVGPVAKLILTENISKHQLYFSDSIISNDIVFSTRLAIHSKSITLDSRTIYLISDSDKSLTANINAEKAALIINEHTKIASIVSRCENFTIYFLYCFSNGLKSCISLSQKYDSQEVRVALVLYKKELGFLPLFISQLSKLKSFIKSFDSG